MNYQGIKISNKIIIVERTENELAVNTWRKDVYSANQGYVVDVGNKKMLATAKEWAKWSQYMVQWHKDMTPEQKKEYDNSYREYEGVINEYDNGTFELTLDESADRSTVGGKLSFWNCILKAPDGKRFLIGINSELLLHLLKSNTFVNGKCERKVWLGRVWGNQVGAFTENMEEFKQSKVDEQLRNTKKTKVYNVGDIVETLTNKELYLGEFYIYCKKYVKYNNYYSYSCGSDEQLYMLLDKPIKVYVYSNLYFDKDGNVVTDNHSEYKYSTFYLRKKKAERLVTGHVDDKLTNYLTNILTNYPNQIENITIAPRREIGEHYPFDHLFEDLVLRKDGNISRDVIINDFNKALEYSKREGALPYGRKLETTLVCEDDFGDINYNDWAEVPIDYYYSYISFLKNGDKNEN